MIKVKLILIIILSTILLSCKDKLPIVDSFGRKQFSLVDQDSTQQEFPSLIKGKIGIVGYIFTNCPDICPLTTNNMRLVQDKLKEENIDGVEFVSISFDPEVDTPEVLKKHVELRNLDMNNWVFLTGEKNTITDLIKEAGVFAAVGDSSVTSDGEKIYYFVHTDRISLIDRDGKVRKNYLGSKVNIEEVVDDIKKLL